MGPKWVIAEALLGPRTQTGRRLDQFIQEREPCLPIALGPRMPKASCIAVDAVVVIVVVVLYGALAAAASSFPSRKHLGSIQEELRGSVAVPA